MKSSSGYVRAFNAQIGVDEGSQVVVAAVVSSNASDNRQLIPAVDEATRVIGEDSQRVLADAGYKAEANLRALEQREIDRYISLPREGKPIPETAAEHLATQRIAAKLQTEEAKNRCRRCKAVVEPVSIWINEILGFRRFSV